VRVRQLAIDGAYEVTPVVHKDARGRFLELYRHDRLAEAIGHPLRLAQANVSVSARGVVRGVHFAAVPPGQAKYVHCVSGRVLDVIVDLRAGSPTFGRWESVVLDDVSHRAVYLAEGLGHGVCALTDGATLEYLCSATYAPAHEHVVHPLDPDLGIAWPVDEPVLSPRDAAAPGLAEVRATGLLPDYGACLGHYSDLRARARG
jgi:dTDP-4-dehydrorhamnose 3,5-epimerase